QSGTRLHRKSDRGAASRRRSSTKLASLGIAPAVVTSNGSHPILDGEPLEYREIPGVGRDHGNAGRRGDRRDLAVYDRRPLADFLESHALLRQPFGGALVVRKDRQGRKHHIS